MNLDIRHFEQVFKPSVLRKGLSLFQKDAVAALRNEKGSKARYEAGSAILSVKRNGHQLVSAGCTCGKGQCEHLAALLFFLQQGSLQDLKANNGRQTKGKKRDQSKKEPSPFESCQAQVLQLIKQVKVQDEKNLNELERSIHKWLEQNNAGVWGFAAHLALLSSGASVFSLRFAQGRPGLHQLMARSESFLQKELHKGLNTAKKTAWKQALLYLLRINTNFFIEAVSYLLPRYLVICHEVEELQQIEELLESRKKRLNYFEHIDQHLVCRLQLKIRMAQVQAQPLKDPGVYGAEWVMAESTLLFCAGKNNKGFQLLEAAKARIKQEHPEQYIEFLNHLLHLARNHKHRDLEIRCLKERILVSLVVHPRDLEQLMQLLPQKQRGATYDALISELGNSRAPYALEKVSLLLLHANRVNELITLLNRQKSRFLLLQDLALKLWPVVPDNFLRIYGENLSSALTEASDPLRRERIMLTAGKYLDQLPAAYRKQVLDNVRKKALY